MKKQLLIIPADIGEYLSYNELTGDLTWIKSTGNGCNRKPGTIANSVGSGRANKKYINIKFRKHSYRAHRIAWFIKTGEQPEEIDHRDGDGLNNKWYNLRNCTMLNNKQNYPKPVTNTSGYKGVSWNKKSNKWTATITANTTRINLGYFDNPELAHEAYCEAANKYHGEFANYGDTS
jgi:hypothetical protein